MEGLGERKYLKDVLPRVFDEIRQWATSNDELQVLMQLDHLFISKRCICGRCVDFQMDSDIDELSRAKGSSRLLRPIFYEVEGAFHWLGLTENEDGSHNLASLDSMGSDYRDGYLASQLAAHGLDLAAERDFD